MPESLIVKLPTPQEGELTTSHNAEILLNIDGVKHKLERVKRACIVLDGDEPLIQVNLTMYSPTFDDEIHISRHMAESIRNHQTNQGLSFLTADDRKLIRELREGLGAATKTFGDGCADCEGAIATLDKLIAEFDRIERELKDIPF